MTQQSNKSEMLAAILSPLTHEGFKRAYGMTRAEAAHLYNGMKPGISMPAAFQNVPTPKRKTTGPGAKLKDRLEKFGINPRDGCKCLAIAQEMNDQGPDWCLANLGKIVDEIEKEFLQRSWVDTVMKAIIGSPIEAARLVVSGGFSVRAVIDQLVREACAASSLFMVVPRSGESFMGISQPPPWSYKVACAIPHFESLDTLPTVVELLRLQTERPYLLVVDTGSCSETREKLELMRAKDVEIHYVQSHGWRHSSEPVSAAMDVAMAVCRSEYLFCTHSDVFLRRRDFIADLVGHNTPAVGYEITDRSHVTDDWRGMISHTATLLHMPVMRRIGAAWSIQRACEMLGIPADTRHGWPDTETGINLILREHGIEPVLIGTEKNGERTVDDNIDHVRSLSSIRIYGDLGHRSKWLDSALSDARERIREWTSIVHS